MAPLCGAICYASVSTLPRVMRNFLVISEPDQAMIDEDASAQANPATRSIEEATNAISNAAKLKRALTY